jgi:hypothetical protein
MFALLAIFFNASKMYNSRAIPHLHCYVFELEDVFSSDGKILFCHACGMSVGVQHCP